MKKYLSMQTKQIKVAMAVAALAFTSCASHYMVSGVERTRILVDSTYDANPDAKAVAFLKPYKAKADSAMNPVVGQAAHDMAARRPESDLSNLLSDILLWASVSYGEHPDFAVYNMGGIRAALSKGNVTFGDVLDVAPFENKICFLTLTGDKVEELFKQMASVGGEGVSRGVNLVITRDGQLSSANVGGKPIDRNAKYRIATIDYLAQGNDRMEAFKAKSDFVSPKDKKNNMMFIISDYFREKQKAGQAVDSKVEGRIIVE